MSIFSQIFQAIEQSLLNAATPFAVDVAQSFGNQSINLLGIAADSSMTSAEKSRVFGVELDAFKTLLGSAKQEGSTLASQILSILGNAGVNEVLGLFGAKLP